MTVMQPPTARHALGLALLTATLLACGDDDAASPGTLAVSVYGEEFIEDQIPADVFSDGWSVTFEVFAVSLGEVRATRGHDDDLPFSAPAFRIYDLARPSDGVGQEVVAAPVPGGTYDHLDYRIAPTITASAANASAEVVNHMQEVGASIYLRGTAQKGERTITFEWEFDTDTRYQACHTNAVVEGTTGSSQITIHGDHLFYDDLVSATPNVAFELIASADTNGDDVVTMAELAAVDITGLERYQVGSHPVTDLAAFIRHQTSTVGHIDGEGHCEAELAN